MHGVLIKSGIQVDEIICWHKIKIIFLYFWLNWSAITQSIKYIWYSGSMKIKGAIFFRPRSNYCLAMSLSKSVSHSHILKLLSKLLHLFVKHGFVKVHIHRFFKVVTCICLPNQTKLKLNQAYWSFYFCSWTKVNLVVENTNFATFSAHLGHNIAIFGGDTDSPLQV